MEKRIQPVDEILQLLNTETRIVIRRLDGQHLQYMDSYKSGLTEVDFSLIDESWAERAALLTHPTKCGEAPT
jgi:hypothetical protein